MLLLKKVGKMCPLWPFHLFLIYLLMLGPLWIVSCGIAVHAAELLPFKFNPEDITLSMDETKQISVYSLGSAGQVSNKNWTVISDTDQDLLLFDKSYLINVGNGGNWTSVFNLTGNFLGKTVVKLRGTDKNGEVYESNSSLPVTVIRQKRAVDTAFTYSVAILVAIIYINFGCALDWKFLRDTIKKPIGPAIGFGCQFVFMPLISYGLGKALFPDSPEMQLGLFFTGLSPAGGASNIWSVALEANVNLSVTMTTISTIAAFAMFPFWLFTLGDVIFTDADVATPYSQIASYVFALVVPLAIGFLIQKYLPRLCRILVMLLKPFAAFLILFIIIFACITNAYLFQLFTWKIAVAGLGLPWLGYFGGFLTAWALRQPWDDILAIAVETGVQNTGIAIFMLRFTLPNPEGDLTTVIPVAVSIMTPIPLALLFIYIKLRNRNRKKLDLLSQVSIEDTKLNQMNNGNGNYIIH